MNAQRRFTPLQARKYAGLTQQLIAEKLKVNVDTYRRIEASPEKTTIEMAVKFSEVVGIPLDQLNFCEQNLV